MAVLEKREVEIPLTGGMNTKQGAELQDMGSLRLVEDLRWNAQGELEKRPATESTTTIAVPGASSVYTDLTGAALIESRGEVYAVTSGYGVLNEQAAYLGAGGSSVLVAADPYPFLLTPKACRVGRLTVDRCSASDGDQGFQCFASATYAASNVLVTAAVVRIGAANGCQFAPAR